jgi:alkylation response protein AidB-like acyl-CoA dehydrogenase
VGGGKASVYFTVFAKTNPAAGARGITGFLLSKDDPGVVVDFIADKMGQRGSYTTNLKLDAWVPKSAIVGKLNEGLKLALSGLNLGRITISAHAIGMGIAAFEEAAKRACSRMTFGKALIEHQSIGFRLADMASRLSAARLMTYEAARAFDAGKEVSTLAAMTKVTATEAAHYVCNEAVQIWGSMGYIKPTKVERLYRDIRINEIYEGSSEVQRIVLSRSIAKEFGLPAPSGKQS